MAKSKADPFLARPDGSRAKSAWLAKLQAAAPETAEQANALARNRNPQDSFLPGNTFERNLEFIRKHLRYWNLQKLLVIWECLLQWHGELALPYLEAQLADKEAIRLIATLQSDAVLELFLRHADLPEVREALADCAKKWPCHTLRQLLALNPGRDQPAAHLLQRLLHAHPEWSALLPEALRTAGDEAQAKTLARLLTPTEKVIEASFDELPALLREPPWRSGAASAALPVLALTARRAPAIVDWSRWQGGSVEPRPRIKSDSLQGVIYLSFDAPRDPLREFLKSRNLLDEAQLQILFDPGLAIASYDQFPIARGSKDESPLAELLAFLLAAQRVTDDELRKLRSWDELHCHAYATPMKRGLVICRKPFDVERRFKNSLDQIRANDAAAVTAPGEQAGETWGCPGMALFLWGAKPERIATALATNTLAPEDLQPPPYETLAQLNDLGHLADPLALALLRHQTAAPNQFDGPGSRPDACSSPAARILKRFGARHIDLILPLLPPANSLQAQTIMDIVDCDALAVQLTPSCFSVRSNLRTHARNWLLAHPATTARALIPAAFSDDAQKAAQARHLLYLLAAAGHGATLKAEAEAYGAPALAAVEQLLATAPEALLPSPLPRLPNWLVPPRLPRLLLAGSAHAVPLANLPDALMPLALSKGGLIHPSLDKLQAAVTPDSLARLMLGLFEQWLENGLPARDRWIFELQGRLGDDANARALAPRIREWRSHLDRVRTYEGLEMLAQIGSDTALMLLSTFREQKRYGDLQERADKALTRVAAERGLTLEALADRTVPTLGLDERACLILDFGPRQFTARLNADLSPQIQDAVGGRLKDLPKPGASDDDAQARAAVADWKAFKKQAKLVASTQTVRLEAAMVAQRRWPAADFLRFFVHHPVLRNLCQRLLWAAFDASGKLTDTFRVCEDLSLADADDAGFALAAEAAVGLPHPLELTPGQRERWGSLLADYKISQPFEQLARLTYVLNADELPRTSLPRYGKRRLSTGSLLGLEQRGWKREVGDGGNIGSLEKPLGDGHLATLVFAPGWFVGAPPEVDEAQEIHDLHLSRLASIPDSDGTPPPPPAWRDLPAILCSEMLRDLERLAWHTRN